MNDKITTLSLRADQAVKGMREICGELLGLVNNSTRLYGTPRPPFYKTVADTIPKLMAAADELEMEAQQLDRRNEHTGEAVDNFIKEESANN